jgi:hypothetical protein
MTATQNETRLETQRKLLRQAIEAQQAGLDALAVMSSDALCDITATPHVNSAWRSLGYALLALAD